MWSDIRTGVRLRLQSADSRLFSPLVFLGTVYLGWAVLKGSIAGWQILTQAASNAQLIVGPVAVAAGFYAATREQTPEWVELMATTRRRSTVGNLPHLLAESLWLAAGYTVGLAFVAAIIVTRDGFGTPSPVFLLAGITFTVMSTAIGYAVGQRHPSMWMLPVIVIGYWAGIGLIGYSGTGVSVLSPVLDP